MIMAKKIPYRGKSMEELLALNLEEFSHLLPARQRRSLKRGLKPEQKHVLEMIRDKRGTDAVVRTHARDMIIIPEMIGAKTGIHNGREFVVVMLDQSMIGHYLGEFAPTRKKVAHSAPGIGATRSSRAISLK